MKGTLKFTVMAVTAAAMVMAPPVMAQDAKLGQGWLTGGDLSLNILQSSYSNNWNGGDKGSIVWAAGFNGLAEKQLSEAINWRNTLKLAYGQTHQQARGAGGSLNWLRPDKTEDLIDLESMFRWTSNKTWNPFVAFNFKSMFKDLTDPAQRAINLNPMTFKESAGISRQFIAEEKRSLIWRLGIAFIQNSRKYFTDPAPADATASASSNATAAEMVTEYKTPILSERVDWESKLTLSQPFTFSGKAVIEDEFGVAALAAVPEDLASYTTTMDVDWENMFSAAITKVIAVKFYVRWVYDKYDNSVKPVVDDAGNLLNESDVLQAIRKAGQFKQTLALAFGYKF